MHAAVWITAKAISHIYRCDAPCMHGRYGNLIFIVVFQREFISSTVRSQLDS